jgi:hypothetical protein
LEDNAVKSAIESFWMTRDEQAGRLADGGSAGGGARANGHMQEITDLVGSHFVRCGIAPLDVRSGAPYLPGYFRVRKQWDLVVLHRGHLVAAIEFKSQVGSVGKNFNNRFEEALGTATDTLAAQEQYRPFGEVAPWLGYVFVLQETTETERPAKDSEALFPIDRNFRGRSYNERYQMMIDRFLSAQIYNAGWFLTTKRTKQGMVTYEEPLATACGAAFGAAIRGRIEYVRAVAARPRA